MSRQNIDEKQIEYWTKRIETMFKNGEKDALEVAKLLKSNYESALKTIEKEIYSFYGLYAKDGNMTFDEARKLLNKTELKSFKEDLKEMLDYAKSNNVDTTKLQQLYTKSRVSRLEELKTDIENELTKLSVNNESEVKELLEDVYEDTYYKSLYNLEKNVGYQFTLGTLDKKTIEKATKLNFAGVNYSTAIWENKDKLMSILNQSIPQGIILGYNPKKVAEMVSAKLNTDYNKTVRLIRTEYNFIFNQATKDMYKKYNVLQYQISATLDNRTSDICREMDLEIFDYAKLEVGVNYPPFHPNCRTTTIPYFEPDEIDEEYGIGSRLAKDENGNYYEVPANTKYNDWYKSRITKEE